VRRGGGGGLLASVPWRVGKANQVRLMGSGDSVNRVINRGMHERKAARGVDGYRLGARSEQFPEVFCSIAGPG